MQSVGMREHRRIIQAAEKVQHTGDAEQEAEIADAIDQKCLEVGEDRARPRVPESDQQIRNQTHRSQPKNSCRKLLAITSISIENVNNAM